MGTFRADLVAFKDLPFKNGDSKLFAHSHSEKMLPDAQTEPTVISLCWLPLILSPGTTEKRLSLSFLYPPLLYLFTLIRSPEPSFLQAEWFQLSEFLLVG